MDDGQGRPGKGMRVLNDTKAHQIRIDQKRMEMVVHCKKSNRLITPKEKKKKTAAASLAHRMDWKQCRCCRRCRGAYHGTSRSEQTDHKKERQDVKELKEACCTKKARRISKKKTVNTKQNKTRQFNVN